MSTSTKTENKEMVQTRKGSIMPLIYSCVYLKKRVLVNVYGKQRERKKLAHLSIYLYVRMRIWMWLVRELTGQILSFCTSACVCGCLGGIYIYAHRCLSWWRICHTNIWTYAKQAVIFTRKQETTRRPCPHPVLSIKPTTVIISVLTFDKQVL